MDTDKLASGLAGLVYLFTTLWLQGCTGVNTFSAVARPGDTVSVMIGGSEQARKGNVGVVLTDAGGKVWDLKALGLVRSVFNLRADGRAYGQHYSAYLDSYISWEFGHEPVQTVLVADVPSGVSLGHGSMAITLDGVGDNSSGVSSPFNVQLDIISGTGASEQFLRQTLSGAQQVGFSKLEPAPYAKITFGTGSTLIGAVSMVLDFDETAVNPNDLNVYVPESSVRGNLVSAGAFGKTQRMVYWHQDGQKIYVDIVAPQGVEPRYLQLFVVHPQGLSRSPAFNILSAQVYGTDGGAIGVMPGLAYFP